MILESLLALNELISPLDYESVSCADCRTELRYAIQVGATDLESLDGALDGEGWQRDPILCGDCIARREAQENA